MSDHRLSRRDAKGDAARLIDAAVRRRLAVAVSDLFLPRGLRLTEWQRSAMALLIGRFTRSIEDDLRVSLASYFDQETEAGLQAALAAAHVEIALPILELSDALADPEFVSLALRRVEEHRLRRLADKNEHAGPNALLVELIRDQDETIAANAMGLLISFSRRLDGFQDPLIATPELPAELEHRLTWTVAAALRIYCLDMHQIAPGRVDRALAQAVTARLSGYDEGEGIDARCQRLVRRLQQGGRLTDEFVARALTEGGLPVFLAALAERCGLELNAVWDILCDPRGKGAVMLLRAADIARDQAASILFSLGSGTQAGEEGIVVARLDDFDALTEAEAHATLSLWHLDPGYRAAIARVSSGPEAYST